ncbi:hypothetical protein O3M35_004240 [Rhynocoris fuscipes]|uniref:Uncharacterized protein n=1 Tax=Rhynocoris fuscipes TaxID=488301 RepID=A0AAW1CGL8_9HEMI
MIPIDLQAQERRRVYLTKGELGVEVARKTARECTLERWAERWQGEHRGRWTARLIPDPVNYYERGHRDLNYYVTQFLTGHGYFLEYLHRMGKAENPGSFGEPIMTSWPILFSDRSSRKAERGRKEMEVGRLAPETEISMMLRSPGR